MQVCDVTAKKVNTLEGHSARVGALAWNRVRLSTGSRVRLILQVGGTFIIFDLKSNSFALEWMELRIFSILEIPQAGGVRSQVVPPTAR